MKVVFAGTPDFALPVLQRLVASTHQVIGVYTQPDRPSGRGRKLTPNAIKHYAETNNIPVYQPISLRDEKAQQVLQDLNADVMIVVGFGMILPEAVLAIPPYGCLNIHPSLLPLWRGPTPVQQAIIAGDQETGVTIMQLNKAMDAGPILLQEKYQLQGDETSGVLYDVLFKRGADLLLDVLAHVENKTITAEPQQDEKATYTGKIIKADAKINWQEAADVIANKVRAYQPWPVAFCDFNGERMRIWQAAVADEVTDALAGTVVRATKEGVDIATGRGVLRLEKMQLPGGKVIGVADFVNAYHDQLAVGTIQFF